MANLPRIVHLDSSRVWRGGQQQLLMLAGELRALGCEQWLVARPGGVAERLQAAGLRVLAPGAAAWRRARGCEIVHAHDGRAHTWMLAATCLERRGERPLRVLSRRVAYPIRGRASAWKYRRLDVAIAVSAFAAAQVEAAGVAREHITVIPDAIDLGALPEAAAARRIWRSRLGMAEEVPCLVCLGAFSEEKGVGDLMAALPLLPAACQVVLSGAGPLEAALRRQAHALGAAGRVHFVAQLGAAPAEWVAVGDVLAMPSRAEGLGSAALLAMALGRPVVAAAAGGIPELIESESSGLLVPPGDAAALAAACRRLLGQPELARRLVTAARQRVEQRHTLAAVATATLAAYRTARLAQAA
jgi:glycosyltransferase involved in cell wall biosynthesis